jgi:AraC-like DNA-binding protein
MSANLDAAVDADRILEFAGACQVFAGDLALARPSELPACVQQLAASAPELRTRPAALLVGWLFLEVASHVTRVLPGCDLQNHVSKVLHWRCQSGLPGDAPVRQFHALAETITSHVRSHEAASVHDIRLREAIKILNAEYSDTHLHLHDVAQKVRLSASHLVRLLRIHTGTGFYPLLLEIRMERAAELLRTTGLCVKEIAFGVGYNSVSTFDRRFLMRYGTSPTDYRRRLALSRAGGGPSEHRTPGNVAEQKC